jgi:WD40 repeat protein
MRSSMIQPVRTRPLAPPAFIVMRLVMGIVMWIVVVALALPAVAAEGLPVSPPSRADKVRFTEEIQPLLAANCTACHNAKSHEGGLMLDSLKGIVAGGDSGPGVVAGKPAESVLFLRAAHRQDDVMPPADNKVGAKHLSPEQLGLLERWIVEGATGAAAVAGKPIAWRPLPAGAGGVVAVAITDNGRTTAATRGGTMSLFDTRTGRLLQSLVDPAIAAASPGQAHRDVVSAVAFAPGGERLATGSFRTIKLWRRSPPAKVADIADSAAATALAVAPSRSVAAIGFTDGKLALVDPGTGRITKTISAHSGAVTGIAFAADGAVVHSCGRDGLVLTTKVDDGTAVARLPRQGEVRAVALLSGGARLATAEADNVVRVWALPLPAPPADGAAAPAVTPLKELTGIAQPTTALVELPTMSGHLLTGSGDGIVRLWNADTAAVVRQFAHEAPISGIAVSPDGVRLATVGTVPGMKLWETASGKRLAEIRGDQRIADRLAARDVDVAVGKQDVEFAKAQVAAAEKAVQASAEEIKKVAEQMSAAEKKLAEKAATADAATKARQDADAVAAKATAAVPVATNVHETAMKVAEAAAATVASAAAAVAAFKAKADAADVDVLKNLEAATAAATAAKGLSDQTVTRATQQVEQAKAQAAEATKKATDATAAQTTAEEAKKQADLSVATARRAVEFAAEQEKRTKADVPLRAAELSTLESQLAAIEQARKETEAESAASAKPFVSASFSGDGAWLACLESDGRMLVLGAADGQARSTWDAARPAGPGGMAAFVGGTRLLVAGGASAAAIWEAGEPWSLERTIGGEGTPPAADEENTGPPVDIVTSLAFSPDGSLLASGSGRPSRSGEIAFWRVADGGLVRRLAQPHSDTVMSLEFSRRGDLLASGGADRFLKVHAVADGAAIRSFEGHTGHVLGVAWQANGRRLASAGADGAIKVWDFASGVQQRTIAVGKKEVTAAHFVGSGEELLAASGEPSLKLYNAASAAVVRDFRGPGAYLLSAAVAGPFAVAGGQDGRLRIWDFATGNPLHTLEPAPAR